MSAWDALEAQAREKLAANGFRPDQMRLRRVAKLHYRGQAYELSVPMPDAPVTEAIAAKLDEAFGDEHERTYGHRAGAGEPVELVSLNLSASGQLDTLRGAKARQPDAPSSSPPSGRRSSAPATAGCRRRCCSAAISRDVNGTGRW